MRLIFLLFSIIFCHSLFPSNDGWNIKGTLSDQNNAPVEFANIFLLQGDSSYIMGTNSSLEGIFFVSNVNTGSYLVKISSIGYEDTYIAIPSLDKNLDLGNIALNEKIEALAGITITADKVIDKVNKQILLPNSLQVKTSAQVLELLSKMSISEIKVDPINRVISAIDGGNVQVRINGVRARVSEITALRPEDVLRIDVYNEPGVRFGNEDISVMLDVILKQKRVGGYVMTDLTNAVTTGFGNDQIAGKVNYKDSEFGFFYSLKYRDFENRWVDKNTVFNIPDNITTRRQDGIKTPFDYQEHNLNFSYNLTSINKYTLNILLDNEIVNSNNNYRDSIFYIESGKSSFSKSTTDAFFNTPVLDIFFKYHLPHKQSLTANIVGTYIESDSERNYHESAQSATLTDIYNKVLGDKYSIIGEFIYEKDFENINLSAGGKHTQGYADNKYTGNSVANTEMQNADTYGFVQVQGKINKLNYLLGAGFTRLWFKEGSEGYSFYSFKPAVQLSYRLKDYLTIRYAFSASSRAPSLAQLSNVEQQIDSFQYTIGNPSLKPYNTFDNRLTLNYYKGIFSTTANLRYSYYDKPIMDNIYLDNDQLMIIPENQSKYSRFGGFLNVNIEPIKDVWEVDLTMGVDRYHTEGALYSHDYTNYWGKFTTTAAYKNFSLNLLLNIRNNRLWGETILYGEDWQSLDLGYKYDSFRFGVGMVYPFKNEWTGGSKSLSELRPEKSWTHIKDSGHMLFIRFSWDLSFGKKSKAGKKSLNNRDTDTGIPSL